MTHFLIPTRAQIYMELKPYFDDVDVMYDLEDEDLVNAYAEMKFLKLGLIDPSDLVEV